jgi:hypothetical protein
MPRYVVERVFDDGVTISATPEGAEACRRIIDTNADLGVTWIRSYVEDDRSSTFDIYDAPNAEAIRRAAARNGLPVHRITRVSVLDPYFHH